jgi:hypothetical protein
MLSKPHDQISLLADPAEPRVDEFLLDVSDREGRKGIFHFRSENGAGRYAGFLS